MKFLILINFLLFFSLSDAQKLTSSQKKEWRQALKEMEKEQLINIFNLPRCLFV